MVNMKPSFVHNLCLFINKAFDVIFIHTKFNVKSKEKSTFNLPIEIFKSFKQQIGLLKDVL
ncbi:hypothetical protein ASJ81_15430 [Methanosarcina spelaei]|uniref:Uncharacterized protein n=1 Tax=Methanosarcina spelaei TaxID=1036679 RepID=A0A2A2HXF0_9EURY|nr:hypothetical protein ASJ81_15430 [Methanosarcina spelaei]